MSDEDPTDSILQRVMASVGDDPPPKRKTEPDTASKSDTSASWSVGGVAGSTRLTTDFGEVPAQLVRVRDKIRSRDGRYLPVLRIHEYKLEEAFLDKFPNAYPVVIRPQSFDRKLPVNTVHLSPAQRLVAPSDWSKRTFVRADTVSSVRVRFDPSMGQIAYYSFDVGQQTALQCEGLWLESHTG